MCVGWDTISIYHFDDEFLGTISWNDNTNGSWSIIGHKYTIQYSSSRLVSSISYDDKIIMQKCSNDQRVLDFACSPNSPKLSPVI